MYQNISQNNEVTDMKKFLHSVQIVFLMLFLASCSATKFVPEGSYLLDEVHIQSDNKLVKPADFMLFLRQSPNAKWFSLFKTQLYVYNLSGRDSTHWANRLLRRMGDAPVIYSQKEAELSRVEIMKAVQNMGFMGASVSMIPQFSDKKKVKLIYRITTGRPYMVSSLHYDIPDPAILECMKKDSAGSYLSEGMVFDVNKLDLERQRITDNLLRHGYYKFNKDYLKYTADTVRQTFLVDLTMHLEPYRQGAGIAPQPHRPYYIDQVNFITDYNVLQSSALSSIEVNDSVHYRGMPIYYKDRLYLRPKVLMNHLYFTPKSVYNEQAVENTYASFGRLQALKYTNIRFFENQRNDSLLLNAYVMLTKAKHQSISFELEGTNSAGDLGTAASVSFQHRNLFRGSEVLMLKLRGAYEAVSGLQGNYRDEDYFELGAEATINFPRFMFPFLSTRFKRKIKANTEFGLQYSYQFRPEFTRIVAAGSWRYRWGVQRKNIQHRVDLLDVNYLYMPWISKDFKEQYLEKDDNYILKYNYEDRLIVRTGYSCIYNSAGRAMMNNTLVGNSSSIRFNFESAGNLLFLLGKMVRLQKNENGEYTLLNIPFAQYIKFDLDFAKNIQIDERNSLAFHVGGGVAIPYGNATVVPLEKRYFSGGANSVRGWSVRDLGPGSFPGDGNFLNQTGDVKLDASVEYRTRLFWKFKGAAFIDAGNIWTLRDYKDQPGGKFKLDKFYKQFAVAYGIGLRLDLDFFVLRFDGGMKAINPARGGVRYPIAQPNFKRDFAFHFAVGYPF